MSFVTLLKHMFAKESTIEFPLAPKGNSQTTTVSRKRQ